MSLSNQQVEKFTRKVTKICQSMGVTPDVRKVEFEHLDYGLSGTAYFQDVKDDRGRVTQFMLDAGGNVWENYRNYGPI